MWVPILGLLQRVNKEYQTLYSHQASEAFHVTLYGSETVLIIITECGLAERRKLFLNLKNQALFMMG